MTNFATKRNALFASLDDASKNLEGTALDQSRTTNSLDLLRFSNAEDTSHRKTGEGRSNVGSELSRLRGKESLFKKPELPIGRCLKPRKAPDYQVNPHKWKKYSLADVDISDQTNTAAAFDFLKQMDEQHELCDESQITDTNSVHIEFKKSSILRRQLRNAAAHDLPDAEIDKPKLRGSKLMMPEYVVGRRSGNSSNRRRHITNSTSQIKANESPSNQLTLSHLSQFEDEDDIVE